MLHHRTVLAIAGEDFAVIASDTRLSQGYSILSRDTPRINELWVSITLIYYIKLKRPGVDLASLYVS